MQFDSIWQRIYILSELFRQNYSVSTPVGLSNRWGGIDKMQTFCYNASNNQTNVIEHVGDWEV